MSIRKDQLPKYPYNDDQKAIIRYLRNKVKEGQRYFKAKVIGADLQMSAYSVGGNLTIISKNYRPLNIYPYASTAAVTWRAEPRSRAKC